MHNLFPIFAFWLVRSMTRTYSRREPLTDANIGQHILCALQPDSEDDTSSADPFAVPAQAQSDAVRGVKAMHELLAAGSAARIASDLEYALDEVERMKRGSSEWRSAVRDAARLMGAGAVSTGADRVVQDAKIRASGSIQRLIAAVMGISDCLVSSPSIYGAITRDSGIFDELALVAAVLRRHCALLRRIDHFVAPETAICLAEALLDNQTRSSSPNAVWEDALFVAARAAEALVASGARPSSMMESIVCTATQCALTPGGMSKDTASVLNALVLWNLVPATAELFTVLLDQSVKAPSAALLGTLVGLTGPDAGASLVANNARLMDGVVTLVSASGNYDAAMDALACSFAINVCDRSMDARLVLSRSAHSGITFANTGPMRAAMWGIVLHDTRPEILCTSDVRIVSEALNTLRASVHDSQSVALLDVALAVFS